MGEGIIILKSNGLRLLGFRRLSGQGSGLYANIWAHLTWGGGYRVWVYGPTKIGMFVENQMDLEHGMDTWVCAGVCLIPMAENQMDQEEENVVEAGLRKTMLVGI